MNIIVEIDIKPIERTRFLGMSDHEREAWLLRSATKSLTKKLEVLELINPGSEESWS